MEIAALRHEEAFGLVIKELRKTRGISQEKLAFKGNLDRTFISLLERGLRKPTLTTIIQLSNALEVEPDKLVALVMNKLMEKRKHSEITRIP